MKSFISHFSDVSPLLPVAAKVNLLDFDRPASRCLIILSSFQPTTCSVAYSSYLLIHPKSADIQYDSVLPRQGSWSNLFARVSFVASSVCCWEWLRCDRIKICGFYLSAIQGLGLAGHLRLAFIFLRTSRDVMSIKQITMSLAVIKAVIKRCLSSLHFLGIWQKYVTNTMHRAFGIETTRIAFGILSIGIGQG